MKRARDLQKCLGAHGIQITHLGFDSRYEVFTKETLKSATVIWSYVGDWKHIDICPKNRTPDWNGMCLLEDVFWNGDETVIQYRPVETNYVNSMKNCLHLWEPTGQLSGKLLIPSDIMVGVKTMGTIE